MKTYREFLYELCEAAQSGEETAIKTLALEALKNHDAYVVLAEKAKEVMTYNEFMEITDTIAKSMFQTDVDAMEDSDFKRFIIDHMQEITKE